MVYIDSFVGIIKLGIIMLYVYSTNSNASRITTFRLYFHFKLADKIKKKCVVVYDLSSESHPMTSSRSVNHPIRDICKTDLIVSGDYPPFQSLYDNGNNTSFSLVVNIFDCMSTGDINFDTDQNLNNSCHSLG